MAAMADWSSLPADLVNRVADCLLADNDLDYYMDFRAVCSSWRSGTADPRSSDDPRFRPLNWVLLDDACRTGSRLFVNAVTGRFLRRELALLRNKYDFITTTVGGLVVLAEKGPGTRGACRLLNPFTGSMIRFVAPVPPELEAASAVVGSSSTTLLLFCESSRMAYCADSTMERFDEFPQVYAHCQLFTVTLRAGFCAGSKGASPVEPSVLLDLVSSLPAMKDLEHRCFMVEESASSPNALIVCVKSQRRGVEIVRMDPERGVLEPVTSLGSRALFLGERCLSVDAGKFSSIRANCVYYEDCRDGRQSIYMHDLTDGREEKTDDALIPWMDYLSYLGDDVRHWMDSNSLSFLGDDVRHWMDSNSLSYLGDDLRPYTVIQLLSNYAVNVPNPQCSPSRRVEDFLISGSVFHYGR